MLNSVETIRERYHKHDANAWSPNNSVEQWLTLRLGLLSYAELEAHQNILTAAALWMLDRLTVNDEKRKAMFRCLPKDDTGFGELPCFKYWDVRYEDELILSVLHVIYHRNGETLELDRQGNPRVMLSPTPVICPGRKRFEALLSLIPQEDIDLAVEHFREQFWSSADRYYEKLAPHMDEISECFRALEREAKAYNEIVDEIKAYVDRLDKMYRSKSGKPKNNMELPQLPELGSPLRSSLSPRKPEESRMYDVLSLFERLDKADERYNKAEDDLDEAISDQSAAV